MKRILALFIFSISIFGVYSIPQKYVDRFPDANYYSNWGIIWDSVNKVQVYDLKKNLPLKANIAVIRGIPPGFSLLEENYGSPILGGTLEIMGFDSGLTFVIYQSQKGEVSFTVFDVDNSKMHEYKED